ncbi:unnamed protein product [Bemisia tabaci]|uniref:Uncharacterized protein n=1 Tax=Bemisia tabaci TaxID=7038 RepID=A0A9P0A2H6_BEMTA|nr:unnamed protein product [Bemisia tabaci]
MPVQNSDLQISYVCRIVVIVGNGAVGKSSMIQRYCKGTFTKDYKKTIGVDFLERQIDVRRRWELEGVGHSSSSRGTSVSSGEWGFWYASCRPRPETDGQNLSVANKLIKKESWSPLTRCNLTIRCLRLGLATIIRLPFF